LLSLSGSFAHEGHDHNDGRPPLPTSTYPRVTTKSELYEVVGILKGGHLAIYLDELGTNRPVTEAQLRVTIGDGEPIEAGPAENGVFAISSPRLAEAGSVEVLFDISASHGDDLLVGNISTPQASPGAGSPPAAVSWVTSVPLPVRNPPALAMVVVGLGVLFGYLRRRRRYVTAMATGTAAVGTLIVLAVVAVGLEGRQPAPGSPAQAESLSDAPRRLPDGTAFVAKPSQRLLEVHTVVAKPETVRPAINLIGRVIGDPNRTGIVQSIHGGRVIPLDSGLPRIGQSVRKGDVLAQVDPYLPLADRTTILEKAAEVEQLIGVAEAKIRRLRPLAERGVVPQGQLIDAEAELEGLRRRREAIRNTRTEPELLRAPTDGVIALAKPMAGQVVQAQDVLFQIVDPNGLWVEALVYGDVDPTSLGKATAAATSGQTMELTYQGSSRALQQHALLVHFAIVDPPPNISVGQPVTVVAQSGGEKTGLVVARNAVTRSANGETIVWLHVDAERFEGRPVRTQPFDASRFIVAAGLSEGERIVVRAADLVNQIR
jgi:RND family efflux transporter MFP subunit